jgi:hypothetical protein
MRLRDAPGFNMPKGPNLSWFENRVIHGDIRLRGWQRCSIDRRSVFFIKKSHGVFSTMLHIQTGAAWWLSVSLDSKVLMACVIII